MRRCATHLLVSVALLAGSPPALARDDGTCQAWPAASETAILQQDELDEVSGMAASHAQPGVLWLHNDSGGKASLYAVGTDGRNLGSYGILGAINEDWEDLAVGPCLAPDIDGCSCIYIADTGSNDGSRTTGVIYRVPEPEAADDATAGQTALAEEIWFQYPDGAHDAEALLVHPDTGEMFLLTKELDGTTGVYLFPEAPALPHAEGQPVTLVEIVQLDLQAFEVDSDKVTGADASPRGSRLVVRTNQDLLLFTAPQTGALSEAFFETPIRRPAPPGGEGEAVAFSPEGDVIYLVQEGDDPSLWTVECLGFVSDGIQDDDPLVDCQPGCGCATPKTSRGPVAWALGMLGLFTLRRRRA